MSFGRSSPGGLCYNQWQVLLLPGVADVKAYLYDVDLSDFDVSTIGVREAHLRIAKELTSLHQIDLERLRQPPAKLSF